MKMLNVEQQGQGYVCNTLYRVTNGSSILTRRVHMLLEMTTIEMIEKLKTKPGSSWRYRRACYELSSLAFSPGFACEGDLIGDESPSHLPGK